MSLLLVAQTSTSFAEAEPETHVDAVSAEVAGDVVSVSGQAAFVDVPRQVGSDPAGDVTLSGLGADVIAATISRPDPNKSELVFTLEVADGDDPMLFGGVPETMRYAWFFRRDGGWLPSAFLLQAQRSAQAAHPGSTDPYFDVSRFTNSGSCCRTITEVPGAIGERTITWTVPLDALKAKGGSRIEMIPDPFRASIQVQLGLSAAFWLEDDGKFEQVKAVEHYVIPEATVELGTAPAGTPTSEVALSADATADTSTREFTGDIPLPSEPGEYIVVARACYGVGNCGTATTTITVE